MFIINEFDCFIPLRQSWPYSHTAFVLVHNNFWFEITCLLWQIGKFKCAFEPLSSWTYHPNGILHLLLQPRYQHYKPNTRLDSSTNTEVFIMSHKYCVRNKKSTKIYPEADQPSFVSLPKFNGFILGSFSNLSPVWSWPPTTRKTLRK